MDAPDQDGNNTHNPTTILMIPWLGYGHLSAYLELAKALSKRNFHIYFCSTPVNLESIKPKLRPPSPSIQLVELHLPSSPELPPHLHTPNGLPSHLMPTLHRAFSAAAQPFEAILQTLAPHLLIYDYFQPWVPRLASSLNIPAINFNTAGVSIISHDFHAMHYPDTKLPFSDFVLHNYWKAKFNPGNSNREFFSNCLIASCDVVLTNSFRELEGDHIDYLSVLTNKKVIPVGPLVDEPIQEEEDEAYLRIKAWLDKMDASSTVLVSFGSEGFISEEEKEEIGNGVEESEANFIWVERFAERKGDEDGQKRRGFLERAGERGMVINGWAPQRKILKHGSIGGFVSHCGWNSVMESIVCGVPIIGVPVHGDQPYNAGVVEEAGVGVEAKRDPDGKIQRLEVAKLIKQVVVEKTRADVMKKAREMSEILKTKADGKIDEFAAQIPLLVSRPSHISAV